MNADAARQAIEGRLLANWTDDAVNLRTPVQFDESGIWLTKVNASASVATEPTTAWLRLTISWGSRQQVSLESGAGTAKARALALIAIQIFVPRLTGSGAATRYGDQLAAIFDRKRFGGLWTRAGDLRRIGPDGYWLQYNFWVPCERDETLA